MLMLNEFHIAWKPNTAVTCSQEPTYCCYYWWQNDGRKLRSTKREVSSSGLVKILNFIKIHPLVQTNKHMSYANVIKPECGLHYQDQLVNPLTPIDPYSGRTAPLTSKRCILYIYSTSRGTEYFKHDIYSPFLSLQNAVCFIILTYLVPVLFTFYIQSVLKLKIK